VFETERPGDQETRIRAYRQAIDAATRNGKEDIIDTYEDHLRELVLETYHGGDRDRYAEEAIYWHRTRDLFDQDELADAFPDSIEQTRYTATVSEQLIEHGTITTTEQAMEYHLLSAEDVLEYAEGRGTDLEADHVAEELADLRARLPVSQIEHRYPGLQDDSV